MASSMDHHVLLVCDMQADLLNSIVPRSKREALTDRIGMCIDAARCAGWSIVYTGVRFGSRYQGVPHSHKVYGGFARLNVKLGDERAHWFLEGHEGSDIIFDAHEKESIVWRQQHLPSQRLVDVVKSDKDVEAVVVHVVGIKTSYAIQASVQRLCDAGMSVHVVRDCIGDDDIERGAALLDHLLPIYATLISLTDVIDISLGLDHYQYDASGDAVAAETTVKYYSNCGRAGHAFLYLAHLSPDLWQPFPIQRWYEEPLTGKSYRCPVGKRVVDFCDEPQFSNISLYIRGREWLDEKEKLLTLAQDFMPQTFRLERGEWLGDDPTDLDTDLDSTIQTVWFLKETNKNGGRAVHVCASVAECVELARPDGRYVVQPHIDDPLLTRDGRKNHVKLYGYLQCSAETGRWDLFSYHTVFLSTGRGSWSCTETNPEAQITTLRDMRLFPDEPCTIWFGWPEGHDKCRAILVEVIKRAVNDSKLQPRSQQKQFEVFSVDFMFDTSGRAWLIEFNFTPVLYDPEMNPELTTKGLIEYNQRYRELEKDDPSIINDHDMIASALSLAFDDGKPAGWLAAGSFASPDS